MSLQLRARAELLRRKRENKGPAIPYEFRGGNAAILDCTDIEAIVVGPAETGKTLALLTHLHKLAYRHPGAQFSIIRKKKTDLYGSAIRTFTRDLLEKYGHDVRPYGGSYPQWYDYPGGSRIWLGGLDDPGKTLSSERDGILVVQAEELSLHDWEYLTRCVTGRGAVMENTFLRGDCNPGHPTHWIKSRAQTGKLRLFTTTHKDNPTLWDGERWTAQGIKSRGILSNLTGSRKLRLYHGLWAVGEGAIYDIFDETRHKIRAIDIPPLWPRFVGVDPFGAFIAALWLAFDPENRVLHVYREYYQPFGITTTGHAQNVVKLSKGETIFAWVGGGPSERQARTDWAAAGVPLLEPPISDVWAQIDRVYNLLKTNSLFIHDSCPALLDEIGAYKRKLKDGQPTEQIENKNGYHCLVGDTKVTTDRGDVLLKNVHVGDYVLTRNGYKRVLRSACTNRNAKAYKVEFSNGSSLIGTAEHPVWVKGKGYIDLLALRYGDIILSKEEVSLWNEKRSNMMGEPGADTQRRKAGQTEAISQLQSMAQVPICTGTSGNNVMVQSPTGLSYTTSMEIRQTILLKILQCLRTSNTSRRISQKSDENRQGSTPQRFGHWQQRGTVRQRVGRGIARTGGELGKTESQLQKFARCVARNTKRLLQEKTRGSVQMLAKQKEGVGPGLMTKHGLAHFAEKNLQSTDTQEPLIAPVSVLSVTAFTQRVPVYNLEVEDAHEFFANGVLVHNCLDSLRYIIAWLSEPREDPGEIVYNPVRIR